MLQELSSMFEKQAGVERFDLIQTFHACKQVEGKSVDAYVLQIKGYVDQLERLSYVLPQDIIVGLILNVLTKDFAGFVRNYNMHNMGKTIGELHAMLIEYEKGLPKKDETPQIMMIKGEHHAKDDACHHCKEVGHWKRNCHVYLVELLKKKKQVGSASSSGIFTIELFAFPNKSWVYDTGCGTHICITKQGFREAKKLKQGAPYLYVGNGVRAQVEAIGSFDLVWPNGLMICLDNFHCAPFIIRGVVSVHRLLQQEGLLRSTDDESFDQCVSCLSSKMTRKSFPHRPERATDLLGIIHTDVCGPLRHVSRQGASYFITFTDDYSRYGYIYLLKPKHEVFETFKVFKKEVENQLGKTIKALRSDRGGEYISQEFKDYLKVYGIVQQLTPPYTPQHNGDYDLEFATCILNMIPTKKVDKTLYELWYGKVLNLSYLKVWGCEALVKRDTPEKLQQRSVKCIFIGYLKETMGYYFYFPPENKIVVARYTEFFEKNLITQEVSGRAVDLEEIQYEDISPSKIISKIPMEVEGFEPPQEEVIPIQIQSMIDNMVWVLVNLPPGYKTVESKCIFKKKTDIDGIVHTYKARLVAKGYTQLYEVDYEETFSHVADIRAIRILISIVVFYDYEIWKMDVKTAFLNGYLDENIWYNLKVLLILIIPEKYARFKDPFMVLSKHQEAGIKYLMRKSKGLVLIKILMSHVYIKRLGKQHLFLGIKIYRDRSKRLIGLGQNAYTDKILKRYKMDNSKHGHIPVQERLDLNRTCASTPKEVKRMQNVPYVSAVGSIIDDTKSQTGYVFILNGGAVDWKSSRQSTIAMSATEAEYIAA
nr:hypothetical protein [Tanacetum cinerariifolium]